MSNSVKKFSPLGRQKLKSSLADIFGGRSCVQYCISKLRPKVGTFLLAVAASEAIHPEIVRMQIGVFVKSAVMKQKPPRNGRFFSFTSIYSR